MHEGSSRASYDRLAREPVQSLVKINQWLDECTLDQRLRRLVEIRVSQLNGCAYCCDLHAEQARRLGESQRRLDVLAAWDEAGCFSAVEEAALAWAESLTRVGEERAPQEQYDALCRWLSEQEIVELTLAIALMNAWNRLAVGFGKRPVAPR